MSLQGNLSGFSLTEIFRMIAFSAKTGNLVIACDAAQGRVHFRDGEVYFASTPENRLPLGVRLVDAGIVTRDQLETALNEQRTEPERRLGEILVGRGLIARDMLADFVREQIQDALFEIFDWDDGTYYFEPAADTSEDIGIALSVDEIVIEAQRRRHEWDEIRKALPSMDCRVRLSTNAVALAETIQLDPQEWAAICLVVEGVDLHSLRGHLHMTALGLCRMIARMIGRGILEVIPAQPASAPALHVVEGERSLEETLTEQRDEAPPQSPEAEPYDNAMPSEPYEHDRDPESCERGADVPAPAERVGIATGEIDVDAGGETDVDDGEEPLVEHVQTQDDAVRAIRKYIREVSGSTGGPSRRKDMPIEWLTYYGRLQHRRSRAGSRHDVPDTCRSATTEKH